jgi:ABC-type Mn2+/Zn2+ transport system permease subunit
MDVLNFYWPNILAAIALVFVLGQVGRHLIGRNQSMEIMLLGQEFQTSILVAALTLSLFETGDHDDHNFHLEVLLTLVFVLFYHFIYLGILKHYRSYRVEGAIVLIVMLMGFSHLVVLMSPVVEFHMVKSFLGDIVTVSKFESLLITGISIISGFILYKNNRAITLDTIEIALFNKTTKKRRSMLIFSSLVLILMLFSIHLFGSLFTVGAMVIPAFISSILNLSSSKYNLLSILNSLSVVLAFGFIMQFDRLPTTVLILVFIFSISLIFSFLFKKSN